MDINLKGLKDCKGEIIIVGAGVAGLTIAYELARNGHKVILIEKENKAGGLARSFNYGDFKFDIGPHRFYTVNREINQLIKGILEEEALVIPRINKIYLLSRYYVWPISFFSIFKLPLGFIYKSSIDLLVKGMRNNNPVYSFKSYIIEKYGCTLYEAFFKEYTEKFFGISPEEIHFDWAETSIVNSVIDKRVILKDLLDVVKSLAKLMPVRTEFIYPRNGMGFFCDKLSLVIEQCGGVILTDTIITGIDYSAKNISRVFTEKESFKVNKIIWTAPINTICGFLGLPEPDFNYLSLILYNIEVNRPGRKAYSYQWCYFGDKKIIFNRISNPSAFSAALAPKGKTGLCAEVTCRKNDDIWSNPQKLIGRIKEDLKKVNIIRDAGDIDAIHIEKIPDAYPIYKLDYHACFNKTRNILMQFENLILAGRGGLFQYGGMDKSIENGLETARKII